MILILSIIMMMPVLVYILVYVYFLFLAFEVMLSLHCSGADGTWTIVLTVQ